MGHESRAGRETFANALRRLRQTRGLTQRDLERLTRIDQTSISRYELGGWCPPESVRVLDKSLDARGELMMAAGLLPDREPTGTVRSGPAYVMLGEQGDAEGRAEAVSQTERRQALRAAGLGMAGFAAMPLSGPDLFHFALDHGSVNPERLGWIEHEAARIAYQSVHVPEPWPLYQLATERFNQVAGLIAQPQRTADRVRLIRSGAALAAAAGITASNKGDFGRATQWILTARSAALDIGDQNLADLALAETAIFSLYEGDPAEAVDMITTRLDHGWQPTIGAARLLGAKARTHAALGDRDASQRAIERARDTLAAAGSDQPREWPQRFQEATLEFYAANAASQVGDVESANHAADRALALFDPDENVDPALVRFDKASALYRSGEVDEACRVATEAITAPNVAMGALVASRADRFDQQLTVTTGAVADWRDTYHARRAGELTA